jgi:hypothetical protein
MATGVTPFPGWVDSEAKSIRGLNPLGLRLPPQAIGNPLLSSVTTISPTIRVAEADFEPAQIQDLGDLIPALLEVKANCKAAMEFRVLLEMGDGKTKLGDQVVAEVNGVLKDLEDGFRVT